MPQKPLTLREARRRRGWTQEQLEELADVSQTTISELERDGGDPRKSTVDALERTLGLKPGTLVFPQPQTTTAA